KLCGFVKRRRSARARPRGQRPRCETTRPSGGGTARADADVLRREGGGRGYAAYASGQRQPGTKTYATPGPIVVKPPDTHAARRVLARGLRSARRRPSLRRRAVRLAPHRARRETHARVVANAPHLRHVALAADVDLPVAEAKPHRRRHGLAVALVGHEQAVLL